MCVTEILRRFAPLDDKRGKQKNVTQSEAKSLGYTYVDVTGTLRFVLSDKCAHAPPAQGGSAALMGIQSMLACLLACLLANILFENCKYSVNILILFTLIHANIVHNKQNDSFEEIFFAFFQNCPHVFNVFSVFRQDVNTFPHWCYILKLTINI